MKFLVVVAFAAILVSITAADIPEDKEKVKQFATECKAEFPLSEEESNKLKTGENFEASENVKCFANCFQEKAGILKDGAIQKDAVVEKLTKSIGEEKAKQVVDACSDEKGANNCDTAFKLHLCYKKNDAY